MGSDCISPDHCLSFYFICVLEIDFQNDTYENYENDKH